VKRVLTPERGGGIGAAMVLLSLLQFGKNRRLAETGSKIRQILTSPTECKVCKKELPRDGVYRVYCSKPCRLRRHNRHGSLCVRRHLPLAERIAS